MKFQTPDGWSVEVVDLYATNAPNSIMDPVGDGEQLLVRYFGHTMAYVATIPELARFFPVASLEAVGCPTANR